MAATERIPVDGIEVRVDTVATLAHEDRASVHRVFAASYDEANHDYLDRSIDRIGMLAVAFDEHGEAMSYAISRGHWLDLPRFDEPQLVILHGMRCTHPDYRHRGVGALTNRAVSEAMREEIDAVGRPARQLVCGRYGHASRAGGRDDPTAVPRVGVPPTQWQREVGLAVAAAYGSTLDPETFVCVGSGTPIGYPNEEFEATESEQVAFAPVDRARGDNLLVINWDPDAPPGWNAPG